MPLQIHSVRGGCGLKIGTVDPVPRKTGCSGLTMYPIYGMHKVQLMYQVRPIHHFHIFSDMILFYELYIYISNHIRKRIE